MMMNNQDINQESTITGWQAVLDAERLRIATRILPILVGVSVGFVVFFVVSYFALGRPWQWAWMTLSGVLTLLLFALAYVPVRRGHLPLAVYLMVLAINIQTVSQSSLAEGMTPASILTGFLAIVFARLLAGRTENRVVVLVSGAAVVTAILLSGFRVFEVLPLPLWLRVILLVAQTVVGVAMTALILDARDERYEDTFAQAEAYARELGTQRIALEERTQDLERRARHLEATAEVAHDATSVLEPQELLSRVVTLVSERFGFYHTGIFLIDPTGKWAVLQAASSEGGQRMLAREHKLRVGQSGTVGYVTQRGEARIALDVGADAVFFDNPDLPDTRSAITLPLRARGEIIGALDVQSKEVGAFSDEDVVVLQALADQVATAISNARLFQQAQESLEAERRAYGELSRQAWAEMTRSRPTPGYRYDKSGVAPLGKYQVDDGEQRSAPKDADAKPAEELPELTLPVRVRGQVIGTISAHKSSDAGEWTAEETALMRVLTDQLNVALEGARLYQDTQRRAAHDRLVSEVMARVRESLDMDRVLQTAVREIGEALGIAEVEVRMGVGPTSEARRKQL